MILKSYELKNDKDSRSVTFTFENKTIQQPKKYVGDIVTKAPGNTYPRGNRISRSSRSQYL